MLIAGLSGFVALSYEILWYRTFSLATGGTAPVFAFVLGSYLLGIAGGSFLARALTRRAGAAQSGRLLVAIAAFILLANGLGFLVLPIGALACTIGACLLSLPTVAAAAALLGAVLPLVCHVALKPDPLVGVGLSRIYAANIAGSVAGTLLTGYVLMEYLPAGRAAVALLVGGLFVAALPALNQSVRRRHTMLWVAAVALTGLVLVAVTAPLLDTLYERLVYRHRYRPGVRFARTLENRAGVINITSAARVFGGGAHDGYARVDLRGEDPNLLVRIAALPALHQPPRRVLMIGLSMGAWAQVVANMPAVESVTVVEINPGYLRLIPEYPDVASVLDHPKVRIFVDDGRRWLTRHPDTRFDLIVANVSYHWREHVTNLLSREFLQLVRSRLEPGGAYFYNTTSSPEAYQTGLSVFPYGMRVLNFLAVSDRPLRFRPEVFAATVTGTWVNGRPLIDPSDPAERRRLEELTAFLTPPGTPDSTAAVEDGADLRRRLGRARVITDDNMATEWRVVSGPTEYPD
jgi:spermidine synthase